MRGIFTFIVAVLAGLLALRARAQDLQVGPLVEISRPNAVGTCNTGFNAFGTWPTDNAEEPFVAVNPVNPNNIVAAWIQGPFQDIVAAVSFDGGQNWQQVPIPFTVCSGGPYLGTGDPQLSFAPNGDLYAAAIVGNSNTGSPRGVGVSKSTDGGLQWSAITVIPGSFTLDPPADFDIISADPKNAEIIYVTWEGSTSGKRGSAIFSRTTDGGLTWEPAREILVPETQSKAYSGGLIVLPGGTLMDLIDSVNQTPNKPPQINLQVMYSADQGQTWSAPVTLLAPTPIFVSSSNVMVVDPKTGQLVLDSFTPWVAMDERNGNLYAVWEDGRFSNFQYNDIALAMSTDGGSTWSTPIRVNQTPTNIPLPNRQAFFPKVVVAADGTIGVTYYDFRFHSANSGLATDYWLVQCHSSSKTVPTDSACWGNEVRLTDSSFNMETVSTIAFGEFFLGDYFGTTTGDNGFLTTFTAVDSQNVPSIFARRVGP